MFAGPVRTVKISPALSSSPLMLEDWLKGLVLGRTVGIAIFFGSARPSRVGV